MAFHKGLFCPQTPAGACYPGQSASAARQLTKLGVTVRVKTKVVGITDPAAFEEDYGGADYAAPSQKQ